MMDSAECELSTVAPKSTSSFHHSLEHITDILVHWEMMHLGSEKGFDYAVNTDS